MKRGQPLRRTTALRSNVLRRTTPKPRTSRDTGPTRDVRAIVWARANGCCERCGQRITDNMYSSVHHRKARGLGGSSDARLNEPSNLVLLCGSGTTDCHGFVESHRNDAHRVGWLLWRNADARRVPVDIYGRGPTLLSDDGTYASIGD